MNQKRCMEPKKENLDRTTQRKAGNSKEAHANPSVQCHRGNSTGLSVVSMTHQINDDTQQSFGVIWNKILEIESKLSKLSEL